jgi:hypothetical protein
MQAVSELMQAKASLQELSLNILGSGSLETGSNPLIKRLKLLTTWLHLPIAQKYTSSSDLSTTILTCGKNVQRSWLL